MVHIAASTTAGSRSLRASAAVDGCQPHQAAVKISAVERISLWDALMIEVGIKDVGWLRGVRGRTL
jgi:hypothetical protein